MAGPEEPVAPLQARLLREAADRLDAGDLPLPDDVFSPLADELELRVDEDAVRDAWAEQGDTEPDPWKAVKALLGI